MSISENVFFRKCPFQKLSISVIVLAPPKTVFTGLGNKSFSPVFKPLKWRPTIDINYADSIVMDDLEGLDPDHKETIRQRVRNCLLTIRTIQT